jgi:hypothetical protein
MSEKDKTDQETFYIIERKDRSVVCVMSWKEMTNHEAA